MAYYGTRFFSPHITTDELMIYWDTINTKCYKGEPATNILPYPEAAWDSTSFDFSYELMGDSTAEYVEGVPNPINADGVLRYTTGTTGYKYWALRGIIYGEWDNTGTLTDAIYIDSILEDSNGTLYAGARTSETGKYGKVFKSTNSGDSWTNTGDLSDIWTVYALMEDSSGNLWAGCYSVNTGDEDNLFKSTDSGTTWTPTGNLPVGYNVYALLEDSNGNFWAGTSTGIYKSTDSGIIWVLSYTELEGGVGNIIEASNGYIYGTGSQGRIIRTINSGTSWTFYPVDPLVIQAQHLDSIMEDSNGTLYVGGEGTWGVDETREYNQGKVLKSTNDGVTWTNTGYLSVQTGFIKSLLEDSSGNLWVSSGAPNGWVFKSTDSGVTWTNTGDIDDVSSSSCMIEDSSNNIFIGTSSNGNVLKLDSTDPIPKPIPLTTWDDGVTLSSVSYTYSLLTDSSGNLFAGTGNNGDVLKSTDSGVTWTNTGELTGASVVRSLFEDSSGNLFAGTGWNGDVFKSTNSGTSWTNTGELTGAQTVFSLCEDSTGAIYAGTGNNGDVFRSTNSGTSWTNTGELTGATAVYSLLVDSSTDNLWAGTYSDGDLFKSTNSGTSWTNTGNFGTWQNNVHALLESSTGDLYLATGGSGYIYKSTDSGDNWTRTGTVYQSSYIFCLMEDSNGNLFAGSGVYGHIFKSTNLGLSWNRTEEILDIDGSYVYSLCKDSNDNLYAGANNGKVYKSLAPANDNSYTFSYYARLISGVSTVNNSQLWRDHDKTGYTDLSVTGDWNPTYTFPWKRFITTSTITDYLDYFPIHGGTITGGVILEFCGFQLEQNSHATSFKIGTRLKTNNIIDLTTNKNSITATDLTYASDNTFSFDGSGSNTGTPPGDYITFPQEVTQVQNCPNGITYDFWINPDVNERRTLLWGHATRNMIRVYCGSSGGSFTTEAAIENEYSFGAPAPPGGIPINTWTNLIIVWAPHDTIRPVYWYKNGVLFHTHANFYSGTSGESEDFYFTGIGKAAGTASIPYSKSWSGDVDCFKIYNKSLSQAEITQNYNTLRERFGI